MSTVSKKTKTTKKQNKTIIERVPWKKTAVAQIKKDIEKPAILSFKSSYLNPTIPRISTIAIINKTQTITNTETPKDN